MSARRSYWSGRMIYRRPPPGLYLQNAKKGLCVVLTKNGLPCTAQVKFKCVTCDRHALHEDLAAFELRQLKAQEQAAPTPQKEDAK